MISEERKNFSRPVQQGLAIVFSSLAILGLLAAAYQAKWILLVVLIGIGTGVLFLPIIRYLHERVKIPKGVVAVVMFFSATGVMLGLTYAVYSIISTQLIPLADQAPALFETTRSRFQHVLSGHPWIADQVGNFQIGVYFKNAASTIIRGLQLGVAAVGGFFFILTLALYLSTNPVRYFNGFLSVFPAHMRPQVGEVMRSSGDVLRKWFGSQLIAMSAVGALTALALFIIGIDYWPLFGLLTGALDLIPYVGPLLAFVSIGLVTLATDPDKAIWVFAAFLAVQQIESNLIVPMVMKRQVELPPIQLMTVMFAFGSWFGILGVLIAPPLVAVGRTIYLMTYVQRMNKMTESTAPPSISPIALSPETKEEEEEEPKRSA